jgi:membrane protease YdiL (CAAX protease family)
MKDRINSLSPFTQVIALILIGGISFVLISIISTLVITSIYTEIPTNDLSILYEKYPVQFMFLYYLPFQLGFLFIPGLIYFLITRNQLSAFFQVKSYKWVVWSFLLFLCVFLLLPFFNLLNESITEYLGVYEALIKEKQFSDQQLTRLIGENSSFLAYGTAIIIIGIVTGIAEELAFRRFLFRHMLVSTNKFWLSVIGSAFVFALLHFNYIQFIPLMAFGVALALMYHASGSIWPGIAVHSLNNILNVYWLRNDNFPEWMESIDPKITIPSTLLLMGLIWYKYFRKQ